MKPSGMLLDKNWYLASGVFIGDINVGVKDDADFENHTCKGISQRLDGMFRGINCISKESLSFCLVPMLGIIRGVETQRKMWWLRSK